MSIGGGKETGEPREETSGTDVGAGGRGRNDRTGRPPPAAANPNGVVGAERAAGEGLQPLDIIVIAVASEACGRRRRREEPRDTRVAAL